MIIINIYIVIRKLHLTFISLQGREPFIRMKMFLEDGNAINKLVSSQYKISPDKLMRTGGYGGCLMGRFPRVVNIYL